MVILYSERSCSSSYQCYPDRMVLVDKGCWRCNYSIMQVITVNFTTFINSWIYVKQLQNVNWFWNSFMVSDFYAWKKHNLEYVWYINICNISPCGSSWQHSWICWILGTCYHYIFLILTSTLLANLYKIYLSYFTLHQLFSIIMSS